MLGPILFAIYINDPPECVESPLYMYTDDTKHFRILKVHKAIKFYKIVSRNYKRGLTIGC